MIAPALLHEYDIPELFTGMKIIPLFLVSLVLASPGCGADSTEKRRFDQVDGTVIKGQFIDLNTNGTERLFIRYSQIADSGVELERTTNSAVVWRAYVRPLGVEHSLYKQEVVVRLEAEKIWVTSTGRRRIHEIRALATGNLISRTIENSNK